MAEASTSDLPEAASPPARGGDEIDPELLALKRSRGGVGPVLLVSVLLLSLTLALRLGDDLAFWMADRQPADLGDARAALASGAFADNTYVSFTAPPDRTAPLLVAARRDAGYRLLPVLGTGNRLWLRVEGEDLRATPAYDESYTGRLRRLAELPLFEDLTAQVKALPPLPRFVDPKTLGKGPGEALEDLAGDGFVPGPENRVEVDERVEGVAVVTIVKTDTLSDASRAAAALLQAGLLTDPTARPTRSTKMSWTWELTGTEGVEALRAKAAEARLFAAVVEPKLVRHEGTFADVQRVGDDLVLGETRIPVASVQRAAVYAPPSPVPKDAWILLAGDAPPVYWYVPLVYGLLALVCGVLVWGFVRTLRRDKALAAAARELTASAGS